MPANTYLEGVRPGGLTSTTEIRILLCYILDSVAAPVSRGQMEEALLGEELVNYFAMAESLAQLVEQKIVTLGKEGYRITDRGRTVAKALASDVPRTVRDTAVRSVIRAQQYAAKSAAHRSEVIHRENERYVRCAIGDEGGALFHMELFMPDDLSAQAVRKAFVARGDDVYKLVLAALTGNRTLAEQALASLGRPEEEG